MNPTIALTYDTHDGKVFFNLSESSSNFSLNSVSVTGGTLQFFGGVNDNYAAYFNPLPNSTVGNAVIKVNSGAFTNAAGNANADGGDENNTITIPVPPTIAITYDPSTTRVDFKLSGFSPKFSINSISVSGGTLQYFGGFNDTYGGYFVPAANWTTGNAFIKVASGAFTDSAGNANADGADSDNTITIPPTTTNTSTGTNNNGTPTSTPANGTANSPNTNNKFDFFKTTTNTTTGTAQNDTLPGTSGDDVINAGDGNDVVTGSAGNDTIDGGTGIDTLSFAGTYATFSVSQGANGAVKLTNSKFGTDNVTNLERFKFSDVHFANDLSGSAGNAAKVITAAFGKAYVPQFLAIGLTLADSGQSIEALCETVTANKLVESIAGDSSTNAYVAALFKNVVGRAPNILELNTFAGMLETGSISRLGLLELAATHSMVSDTVNALSVELVGIAYEPGF
jgi:hypothetical protein